MHSQKLSPWEASLYFFPQKFEEGEAPSWAQNYNLSAPPGGGGGTPKHYLYGYVPPNRVVILKLLI